MSGLAFTQQESAFLRDFHNRLVNTRSLSPQQKSALYRRKVQQVWLHHQHVYAIHRQPVRVKTAPRSQPAPAQSAAWKVNDQVGAQLPVLGPVISQANKAIDSLPVPDVVKQVLKNPLLAQVLNAPAVVSAVANAVGNAAGAISGALNSAASGGFAYAPQVGGGAGITNDNLSRRSAE